MRTIDSVRQTGDCALPNERPPQGADRSRRSGARTSPWFDSSERASIHRAQSTFELMWESCTGVSAQTGTSSGGTVALARATGDGIQTTSGATVEKTRFCSHSGIETMHMQPPKVCYYSQGIFCPSVLPHKIQKAVGKSPIFLGVGHSTERPHRGTGLNARFRLDFVVCDSHKLPQKPFQHRSTAGHLLLHQVTL
jgi:hypothetical protein